MRVAAAVLVIATLATVPLGAQGRGRGRGGNSQGIPPGHLPPAGQCRVWYEGRPPGHQPPPTSCREAERIASRDRYARVIYGGDRAPSGVRGLPRSIPRQDDARFPGRYPNTRGSGSAYTRVAFDNGYVDGLEKGQEDARKNRSYDLQRHSRYRSADRGYEGRYGSKDVYRDVYRDGFQAGYDEGYRDGEGSRRASRLPWPF